MTSKGQITVPKEVRDALGIKPGGKATFRFNNNGEVVIERPKTIEEQLMAVHRALGKPTFTDPLSKREKLILEGMRRDGHKIFRRH
jgi:AbrB family looped-hinge helix DNA binding protein